MESLTQLFKDNGWMDKFPKGVLDIVSYKGEIYSVPVNIHRSNVLWYNPQIFRKYNIQIPTTMDELFKVCETLKQNGVIAFALGDTSAWTATQLLENVILADAGPQKYLALWNGTCKWDDKDIVKALNDYAKLMNYVNPDHSAYTDMNALTAVAEGKMAMNLMGDWALGLYQQMNKKEGTDWEWTIFPGTKDSFILISDSFGLPKNVKNRENAIKWLDVCGSVEGQDAFNPIKGSIPSRLDADKSKYSDYQKKAMDDFAVKTIVPSVAHGSAISEAWVTKVNDIVNVFTSDKDVNAAIKDFQATADKYAPNN
jgi:glucose/mannose transport system substrate-binding protein